MDNLPKDPIILLSYVNTKLRDDYSSLDELCASVGADIGELRATLAASGYEYSPDANRFV